MTYRPEPIETSGVPLSEELLALTEVLAKNAHDLWAQQRLAEGWTYGPRRDDVRKEHPCLVPYEQLPDVEKAYDRRVAIDTVKTLVVLGCRIVPPPRHPAAAPGAFTAAEAALAGTLSQLQAPTALDLTSLLRFWQARQPSQWARTPAVYRLLGERLLKVGEPLVAYDVVTEGLHSWPRDVRLRQLQGLALARSHATDRAYAILQALRGEGHADEETLGMLARLQKDRWALATTPADRAAQGRLALAAYEDAYRRTGGAWTGINAATMALLVGETDRARTLARAVREQCLQELPQLHARRADVYWTLATLGEAALILGEWAEAEAWYARAGEAGRGRYGDLSATRRQARLVLEAVGADRTGIERALRLPRVVVFAGPLIDEPGRAALPWPPPLEQAVSAVLRERLTSVDAGIGYAPAACGLDLLFLETILALNGEAHVVLPYAREQWARDRVDLLPGADWRARYARLLERVTTVTTASEQPLEGGSSSHDYATLLLQGLGMIRAEQLDADLVLLAARESRPGCGPQGTASLIEHWQQRGYRVEWLELPQVLHGSSPERISPREGPSTRAGPQGTAAAPAFATDLMAMLFADAVGFSKLTEAEVPRFVRHFLGAVADFAARSCHAPVMKNTWGDGLYLVFPSVRDAGMFALALAALVRGTDWAARGLPAELSLRLALHAGPVYRCLDPVTTQTNYIGTHVSRAARIEPITPPGQAYASQAFAALAAAQGVREFAWDYVGQLPLAKGYGTFPTYHIRSRQG